MDTITISTEVQLQEAVAQLTDLKRRNLLLAQTCVDAFASMQAKDAEIAKYNEQIAALADEVRAMRREAAPTLPPADGNVIEGLVH